MMRSDVPSINPLARHATHADTRLRLLLFTNSVAMGGMEAHVVALARDLDRSVFQVFAICPRWPETAPLREQLSATADVLDVITPDRRWGITQQLREVIHFFRQLRAWRIDVLHMHSTTYRGQFLALLSARLAGVRHVYVTEHLAPDQHLPLIQHWIRNLLSAWVSGIICVSRKNYQARHAHVYTPDERTWVVNNGVDLQDFAPVPAATTTALRARYGIPADAPIVGTAVRFEPEKGLDYFLDAMPSILRTQPDTHFMLVGDGSLRAELTAHAERLGIAERVHFTGFQSDPRPFLVLMNVFVLPVPVGSMSIGLLEAMAMERAVVMTFGGEGEAVIDGESGLCAEPRNPHAIADAVIRILADVALQQQLGHAARQRVATAFSAQGVADTLAQLYQQGRSL